MTRAVLLMTLALLPTPAFADGGELSLPPAQAFAIGARVRVKDAGEMDPRVFNRALREAHARGEAWTENFLLVASRFVQLAPQGRYQQIVIETSATEWEPGRELEWVRVSIEDRDWLDDSARGERWLVWLVPAREGGGFEVARGLHAYECQRSPEMWFYSGRCP